MKKTNFLISGLLLSCLCVSCAPNRIHYDVKDYKETLTFKDNFLICQLSDLHYGTATNLDEEFAYLDKMIYAYADLNEKPRELYKPNLIILNGDSFMGATKHIVKRTFEYFDSLKIPFAFTYGNHDYQGSYSVNYINDCLNNSEYAMFKNPQNDDVYGNCNYVIDLIYGNDLKFQIYLMDSNSYVFGKYDNIHQDQVDWYERCLLDTIGADKLPATITKDTFPVKNLTFFHIPTLEFNRAVDEFHQKYGDEAIKSENEYCEIGKKAGTEGDESKIMDKMHQLKATVGVGVAHDHFNTSDLYSYRGTDWPIRLIYGNKTGANCGTDLDNMGATFYSIYENVQATEFGDKYFEIEKILMNYEGELKLQWKN